MKLGNEVAYPRVEKTTNAYGGENLNSYPGMTIRQYFVAQAMAGLCANKRLAEFEIPQLACNIADECLAEEEKTRCLKK